MYERASERAKCERTGVGRGRCVRAEKGVEMGSPEKQTKQREGSSDDADADADDDEAADALAPLPLLRLASKAHPMRGHPTPRFARDMWSGPTLRVECRFHSCGISCSLSLWSPDLARGAKRGSWTQLVA